MKLKNILFKEADGGGFHGGPKFQGGPYGYGNRYQLAASEMWPGLADPAEDLPNNPSMWPAVHAQHDSDREQYGDLESADVYDDRNHLSPLEDTEREDLLDPKNDVEPSYFYNPDPNYMAEDAARVLYRDLPGFPAMNTLADPEDHVPDDQDPDREVPEEERYNIPNLLPSPREGERGIPFGHGPLNTPGELSLQPGDINNQMYDASKPEGNELRLTRNRNQTLNRWKETTQVDKGHTNRDEVFNHLVKPVDFIKKSWGQTDYAKQLDEPEDVPLAVGHAGVIANPVKHVPGPVNIYSKSPGYVRESKAMSKKSKEEVRVEYVPKDLDKTMPKETYGTGMGQVLVKNKHLPKDFGNKDLKTFEPLETDSPLIPYTYDPENIVTIIQTKVFEKLAKLKKSENK